MAYSRWLQDRQRAARFAFGGEEESPRQWRLLVSKE